MPNKKYYTNEVYGTGATGWETPNQTGQSQTAKLRLAAQSGSYNTVWSNIAVALDRDIDVQLSNDPTTSGIAVKEDFQLKLCIKY